MDPPYTYPGMYQPQQLWSPEPYPLAQTIYCSYPHVTRGAGVEVTQAVRGCNNQSDNEEGESEVSLSALMMGWVDGNVGQVSLAVAAITGHNEQEKFECARGWEECQCMQYSALCMYHSQLT